MLGASSTPLTSMREYIGVLQAFFRNEVVEFDGEFVRCAAPASTHVPAQRAGGHPDLRRRGRPPMLELSGEIADGVHLDFLLPPSYLDGCAGGDRAGHREAHRREGRRST